VQPGKRKNRIAMAWTNEEASELAREWMDKWANESEETRAGRQDSEETRVSRRDSEETRVGGQDSE